jgi:hypothetical protein
MRYVFKKSSWKYCVYLYSLLVHLRVRQVDWRVTSIGVNTWLANTFQENIFLICSFSWKENLHYHTVLFQQYTILAAIITKHLFHSEVTFLYKTLIPNFIILYVQVEWQVLGTTSIQCIAPTAACLQFIPSTFDKLSTSTMGG